MESNLGTVKLRVGGVINGVADYSPPSLSRISPGNKAWASAAGFAITGSASDKNGIALVEFRLGNGPWQPATGTAKWSAQIPSQPLGTITVQFRSTDNAGNQSAVSQRVYRLR